MVLCNNLLSFSPEFRVVHISTKETIIVMVSLTDSAVKKFKEVVEKQGTSEDGVRIFVVPGG